MPSSKNEKTKINVDVKIDDIKPDISNIEPVVEADYDTDCVDFNTFKLDERLRKGIAVMGWHKATPIQSKMIPLALAGTDVLARARTGSGKTAAFLIPIIQMILDKKLKGQSMCMSAIILAPTRELCRQIFLASEALCTSCLRDVRTIDVSHYDSIETNATLLSSGADILVSTPTKIVALLEKYSDTITKNIKNVVIDEADLLFSFGYHDATIELIKMLPPGRQVLLTSATLSNSVRFIKKELMRFATDRPKITTLKLNDGILPNISQLRQFQISCKDEDKFVLLYALIKLRLLRGKSIMFVRTVDRCFKLKLFLEQFGVKSCVLNAQMPVNSRCHIVQQFNEDEYSYIIASDACELQDDLNQDIIYNEDTQHIESKEEEDGDDEKQTQDEKLNIKKTREGKENKSRKKRMQKIDAESGIGRGIDFTRVANVINFDMPPNVQTYIHRVGRTARGWSKGTALTFAVQDSIEDDSMLDGIRKMLLRQLGNDSVLKPYNFRMQELDGFRYRARDVLKLVSRSRIRETRLAEIREELLKSQKLQAHFAAHPNEIVALRHDTRTKVLKRQEHLKHVPEYIVPEQLKGNDYSMPDHRHGSKRKGRAPIRTNKTKRSRKSQDPLKNFDAVDDHF